MQNDIENSSGFEIMFRETGKDLSQLKSEESITQINFDIEKLIREIPYQHQWTYKRFKEQAEEDSSCYKTIHAY